MGDKSLGRALPDHSQGEDLEQLMLRYQHADSQAVAELVEKLKPRLLRYFSSSHLTRPYAEDLMQEFWIRIHKSRHSYRPGAAFLPWVYAIARYTLIDGQRRLHRTSRFRELDLDHVTQGPAANVDEAIDLERVIAKLPANQRKAFVLLKVSGLSLAEAAVVMDSSVGAVKQRAHRAYVNLRSAFRDNHSCSRNQKS